MTVTSFEFESCELNVGPVAFCADWSIAIEGDGHSFEITHVWVEGKRADEFERACAQRWFDGDLASTARKSRIRKAYANALADHTPTPSADRADFEHDERMNREAA